MKKAARFNFFLVLMLSAIGLSLPILGQSPTQPDKQKVRTVTVPISIFTKKELQSDQPMEYIQAERLIVKENKEEQTILSIRSVTNTVLALQILIQDDLTGDINLQLPEIRKLILGLPRGTRVMVGYLRGGSVQIRQRFTDDLEKAANSLRVIAGSGVSSGNGPYGALADSMGRFDGLPVGRRAVLLISDGLDTSEGITGFGPLQSLDLDRATTKAQKRGVAVYSVYAPTKLTESGDSRIVLAAQGALNKISEETGGRAFYQGSLSAVSFEPFFKDLSILLSRQFALTYLSTHMKKGYYKLEILSTNPEVKIEHPKGYYYR